MLQLDTSFLFHARVLSSPADRCLRGGLGDGDPLAISSVAWPEFLCGPIAPIEIESVTAVLGEIVA